MLIANRNIEKVMIVDDDPEVAKSYESLLRVYGFDTEIVVGPIPNTNELVRKINTKVAVICDYNLTQRKYAGFKGAEAVRELYRAKVPSILCTRYGQAEIDDIREFREWVPVLMNPDEFEEEPLRSGIETCIREFNDEFSKDRKVYRTVARIDDANDQVIYVILPGWDPSQIVRVARNTLPLGIQSRITNGEIRFMVKSNIGTDDQHNLYFKDWE